MGFKQIIIMNAQCNNSLNRKAMCIKRSWDEVSKILDILSCACPCKKKKCCNCNK
ncbi:MAG: hypothetical protein HFH67_17420 [Lachnospiraceae bacterium]|nr:hypothetical protein [Lachnospiraceae bacterium]MDE7051586.1 hypothetical protein [Lachnospiraceae bacterium]